MNDTGKVELPRNPSNATTVGDTSARLDVRAALIRNSTVAASTGWRSWDDESSAAPANELPAATPDN